MKEELEMKMENAWRKAPFPSLWLSWEPQPILAFQYWLGRTVVHIAVVVNSSKQLTCCWHLFTIFPFRVHCHSFYYTLTSWYSSTADWSSSPAVWEQCLQVPWPLRRGISNLEPTSRESNFGKSMVYIDISSRGTLHMLTTSLIA